MLSNLFLAMCKTMAGIARSPPRCHLPCRHLCIPPLLVRLARLLVHLMGQRRWYHPLEEHFVLSNLTPAMCKTMPGQCAAYYHGADAASYRSGCSQIP